MRNRRRKSFTCWDIEMSSVRELSVEEEVSVGLEEWVVRSNLREESRKRAKREREKPGQFMTHAQRLLEARETDLDRPITSVGDSQLDSLPSLVDLDGFSSTDDGSGGESDRVELFGLEREEVVGGDGEEGTVKSVG